MARDSPAMLLFKGRGPVPLSCAVPSCVLANVTLNLLHGPGYESNDSSRPRQAVAHATGPIGIDTGEEIAKRRLEIIHELPCPPQMPQAVRPSGLQPGSSVEHRDQVQDDADERIELRLTATEFLVRHTTEALPQSLHRHGGHRDGLRGLLLSLVGLLGVEPIAQHSQ